MPTYEGVSPTELTGTYFYVMYGSSLHELVRSQIRHSSKASDLFAKALQKQCILRCWKDVLLFYFIFKLNLICKNHLFCFSDFTTIAAIAIHVAKNTIQLSNYIK